jgi:hypothetical protein
MKNIRKIKIKDNFLKQDDFDRVKKLLTENDFPWFFRDKYYAMDWFDHQDELDKFQFTHTFYEDDMVRSEHMNQLNCFMELIRPISIFRITTNLLPRTSDIVENALHVDMFLPEEKLKQWTTALFYVNTNNGYTKFEDGTKVESVENRMIIFPANMKHTGTSCTNQKTRVVINFNYFANAPKEWGERQQHWEVK